MYLNCHESENLHLISGEKPKLNNSFKYLLPISSEWANIGALLEVSDGDLALIADEERSNTSSKLRAMLTVWLKQVNPPPTWSQLAEAIEHFNQDIARIIRNCCFDISN